MNSKKLAGYATAAAAIGLLITPAPAHARPDSECYHSAAGYQFAGGEVVIVYPETDAETHFNAPRGTRVDAPAETFYKNGTSLKGRVTGDIDKGGNWIRLTVTRGPKYPPLLLTGAVMPNNTPAGNFTFENHDLQAWESPTELACIPGAPVNDPLPKRDQPKPVVPEQQNPAPQGLGNATVVADTDIYDKPDGKGQKIGTLFVGEVHPLMEPCRNDWCRVGQIELGGFPGLPNGTAWVYAKGFLTFSN